MIDTDTVIAANRFGLGARPGDLDMINSDPQGWLIAQVNGPQQPPQAIRNLAPSAEILANFQQGLAERLQQQRRNVDVDADNEQNDLARQVRNMVRRDLVSHYTAQVSARVASAVSTELPFRERLIHFWTNHFAVSADKPPVVGLAGAFENEVIRPHVSGYFQDLLIAVESHPAMITYLENQRSIGPDSRLARLAGRRPRRREINIGINENLAREILELHTLGVDGGYTQIDVVELSKALTGWSLGGGNRRFSSGKPGYFEFQEMIHEPGRRTIWARATPTVGSIRHGLSSTISLSIQQPHAT